MNGGLFPQVQNNMLGLRYLPSTFIHPTNPPNTNQGSILKKDVYQDGEVFFRWFPSKRLQLWTSLPIKSHIRYESERTTQITGPGDLQFQSFYTVLREDSSRWKHLILGGLGLSLPSGKYLQRDETLSMLPVGFQLGTGSWSGSFSALYMLRYLSWGATVQADVRAYTENENFFQKGRNQSAQLNLFRQLTSNHSKHRLLMQVTSRFEELFSDQEFNKRKENTGSKSLWFGLSLDYFGKSIFGSLQVLNPVYQNYPGSQPVPGMRLGCSIGWMW